MGRIVTEVTKLKISKGNKGKVRTEETLKRLSLVKSGLPSPFKGVKKPNQTGSKHWKWIQDRTKVRVGERILNDPLQKGWCKAVKNRDSWKCRIANSECKGRLEAHHILTWKEHPELRYEVNNGITLCHHHHPRKKEDVVKLSPYFKQLVATLD